MAGVEVKTKTSVGCYRVSMTRARWTRQHVSAVRLSRHLSHKRRAPRLSDSGSPSRPYASTIQNAQLMDVPSYWLREGIGILRGGGENRPYRVTAPPETVSSAPEV